VHQLHEKSERELSVNWSQLCCDSFLIESEDM
jgi:hypothetical protein